MEVIEHHLKIGHDSIIKIYPIGDIHVGSPQCAEKLIHEKIEQISQDPKAYIIGMGDYADCITKNDKRFDIEGLASWVKKDNIINSQLRWVTELFMPVKHKILGLLTGNHEEKIRRDWQYDFTGELCRNLEVPYGGYVCYIRLHFTRLSSNERHLATIHAWHGAGGAQTEGARTMRLMRLTAGFPADLYLMGHLHAMTTLPADQVVCNKIGRLETHNIKAAMTGSWLYGYRQPDEGQYLSPSYAETKGYQPSVIGCPCISLQPHKKLIKVVL